MTLKNETPSEFVIPTSWRIRSLNFKKPIMWLSVSPVADDEPINVSPGDKPSTFQIEEILPEPVHSCRKASSSGSKPSTSHRTRSLSKQRQHGRKSRASSDPPKSYSKFSRNHYQAQKEHNVYDDPTLSEYYYPPEKSPPIRTRTSSHLQSLKGHGVAAFGWGTHKMKTIQKAVLKKIPIKNVSYKYNWLNKK